MTSLAPDALRSPLLKVALRLRLLPGDSVRDPRRRIGAEFDFDGIDGAVRNLRGENDAGRRWFSSSSIEPLEVLYEQPDADAGAGARDVLSFVGIDPPQDLTVTPRHARQSDAVNAEWIRRYRELALEMEAR